jgi:hypothetical protein
LVISDCAGDDAALAVEIAQAMNMRLRAATAIFFMPGYQAAKHRKSFRDAKARGYFTCEKRANHACLRIARCKGILTPR